MGEKERLSQTIYYFEATLIEFSLGFGYLGSNPHEMDRYLNKRGYKCIKYKKWSQLKAAIDKEGNFCKVILSEWIDNKVHTFFFERLPYHNPSNYYYSAFNFRPSYVNSTHGNLEGLNYDEYVKKLRYIVGYIVTKKK